MKRKLLLTLLCLSVLFIVGISNKTYASQSAGDYTKFSSITFSRGKLLTNYTDEEIKPYKRDSKKTKAFGWTVSYMNKRVKCNFISETIMSVSNNGTTAIKYKVQTVESSVYKTSISASGSLGLTVKGTVKKFSGNLDSKLKIEGETSKTIEVKTTENLEIEIDPNTKVTMYLCGDGYLTNGYARQYLWFCTYKKGCFEFFEISNIYPRIVKESL